MEGVGLDGLGREAQMKHSHAFQPITNADTELAVGGNYQYRIRGEYHLFNPLTVSKLQHAVRQQSYSTFREYTDLIDKQNTQLCTLRGLLEVKKSDNPVPLDDVEPAAPLLNPFPPAPLSFSSIPNQPP